MENEKIQFFNSKEGLSISNSLGSIHMQQFAVLDVLLYRFACFLSI